MTIARGGLLPTTGDEAQDGDAVADGRDASDALDEAAGAARPPSDAGADAAEPAPEATDES